MNKLLSFFSLLGLMVAGSCQQSGSGEYGKWDSGDDGISREEFYEEWQGAGYWGLWDRNNDSVISESEWNKGLDDYYDKFDRDQYGFRDFDLNNDGFLDSEEMAEGEFVLWDSDGDGNIERVEFNKNSYRVPDGEK